MRYCHTGNIKVFKINDNRYCYAGGYDLNADLNFDGIIIDLAENCGNEIRGINIDLPESLIEKRQIISIKWPDFGVLKKDSLFWKTLADFLLSSNKDILIVCGAGHGRTGTALSILGHFWKVIPENKNPIEFIRTIYCSNAVETILQMKYIEHITGRNIKETILKYRFLEVQERRKYGKGLF